MISLRVARLSLNCKNISNIRNASSKTVAVILSGSGVYDGSEIHEASSTLIHLTRLKYDVKCYAPDIPQLHVINHACGQETEGAKRNVLVESARIARGNICPLSTLNVCDTSAAIFPGGFGAAKNLSDFAIKGQNLTVNPDIAKLIKDLKEAKKPIAFMCIAPIIAARVIPGVTITLGQDDGPEWPHKGAIEAARVLGAKIKLCNVDEVCVDEGNLVLSTPAFMYEGSFYEIFCGIGKLIDSLDGLLRGGKK